MRLTLGISPCPNDTFIFDALVNGLVDREGLDLEVVHEDVQTLNEWALLGRLDVSKISYGVLPRVADRYALLEAGGALGLGVQAVGRRKGIGAREAGLVGAIEDTLLGKKEIDADLLGRDDLHVVEPLIRVEPALRCLFAHLRDVPGTRANDPAARRRST